MQENKPWFVYLIRTDIGHLYCGITTDLERRLHVHQSGKGAKYLKGKGPLLLVWSETLHDKSQALKVEVRIKRLSKTKKEQLIVDKLLFKDIIAMI
ncbi:GIY-YIG nuclease family protein [Aliivibrio kagoshimensis]|uniref:GIY-YIG nuclease family protein n=1 Tax=Aliivibrio kagoshimensis TaxID=2910230 RepID=UPI003D0E3C3E